MRSNKVKYWKLILVSVNLFKDYISMIEKMQNALKYLTSKICSVVR